MGHPVQATTVCQGLPDATFWTCVDVVGSEVKVTSCYSPPLGSPICEAVTQGWTIYPDGAVTCTWAVLSDPLMCAAIETNPDGNPGAMASVYAPGVGWVRLPVTVEPGPPAVVNICVDSLCEEIVVDPSMVPPPRVETGGTSSPNCVYPSGSAASTCVEIRSAGSEASVVVTQCSGPPLLSLCQEIEEGVTRYSDGAAACTWPTSSPNPAMCAAVEGSAGSARVSATGSIYLLGSWYRFPIVLEPGPPVTATICFNLTCQTLSVDPRDIPPPPTVEPPDPSTVPSPGSCGWVDLGTAGSRYVCVPAVPPVDPPPVEPPDPNSIPAPGSCGWVSLGTAGSQYICVPAVPSDLPPLPDEPVPLQETVAWLETIPDPILGWDWSPIESVSELVPSDPQAFMDNLLPGGDTLYSTLQNPTAAVSAPPPQIRGMCRGRFERSWSGTSGIMKKTITDGRYSPPLSSGSKTTTHFNIAFKIWQCSETWTAYMNLWIRQGEQSQTDFVNLAMNTSESKLYSFKFYTGVHPDYKTQGRWAGREYIFDVPRSEGTPVSIHSTFKTMWRDQAPAATYGKNWCWPSFEGRCYGWTI